MKNDYVNLTTIWEKHYNSIISNSQRLLEDLKSQEKSAQEIIEKYKEQESVLYRIRLFSDIVHHLKDTERIKKSMLTVLETTNNFIIELMREFGMEVSFGTDEDKEGNPIENKGWIDYDKEKNPEEIIIPHKTKIGTPPTPPPEYREKEPIGKDKEKIEEKEKKNEEMAEIERYKLDMADRIPEEEMEHIKKFEDWILKHEGEKTGKKFSVFGSYARKIRSLYGSTLLSILAKHYKADKAVLKK